MGREWPLVIIAAVGVGAAGCNQVLGLEGTGLKADARPIDGPGCSDGVFGAPELLAGFEGGIREFEPTLRHDLLELWFMQIGPVRDAIYRATRADPDLPFGAPELATFSSIDDDSDPTLTGDGLRLLFTSDRIGENDVFEVTRASLDQPFGAPATVLGLAEHLIHSLDISFDGLTLYFMDQNAIPTALYAASRPALDQPFGDATLVADLGSFPAISPDSLELFHQLPGASGIYRSARSSPTVPFTSPPVLLLEDADDPDLAPDGKTLIVARNSTLAILRRDCP